jgi:phage major head subunit gpT-like protein
MRMDRDQPSETYKWLGMSPMLREWVGGRQAKGFLVNGITIDNKHYEATVDILEKDMRRDKTGQINVRIGEMATRANTHFASLLSTLILAGHTTGGECYDGQYFFDTDHSEGDSGTQSNSISADISEYPTVVAGDTTKPSVEEFQQATLEAVTKILSFVDDRGEPMNENAANFIVMVPPSFGFVAQSSLLMPFTAGTTVQRAEGLNIVPVINTRLSTWTTQFAVFRTDGSVKPFIRQEERGVQMKAKAEGSEYAFDNAAYQFGIDTWRNVAYGYWQHACKVTLV